MKQIKTLKLALISLYLHKKTQHRAIWLVPVQVLLVAEPEIYSDTRHRVIWCGGRVQVSFMLLLLNLIVAVSILTYDVKKKDLEM